MRKITTIIVHHSAGPQDQTLESVDAFHRQVKGYTGGIGYHFIVHRGWKDGPWTWREGRPVEIVGAHDRGQNTGSIGVCIFGSYTRNIRDMPPLQGWRLAGHLVAGLMHRFGLTPNWVTNGHAERALNSDYTVQGHCENEPPDTPTACPGFDPALFRDLVFDLYHGHNPNGE